MIFAHARTRDAFVLPAAGPVSHRIGARLGTRRATQGPQTSCRDYPPAWRPSGCSRRQASEVESAAGSRRLNRLLCCVQLIRGFGLISAGQHTEGYEALCRVFDPADPSFHLARPDGRG
jgi:hypothetical protein